MVEARIFKIVLFCISLIYSLPLSSQEIEFSDQGLKAYLIQQACIDTNNNGLPDIDVDTNNNDKIEESEVKEVLNLHLDNLNNSYNIESLEDLEHFEKLRFLRVFHLNELKEFAQLQLDSLQTLRISTCFALKIVDISNLPGLSQDLRVEDIDTLDHLNIQNGNNADYFSLFYTEHIHYACIDSNLTEYEELEWRMISAPPQFEQCELYNAASVNEDFTKPSFKVYPNPSSGKIRINSSSDIYTIKVYNIHAWQVHYQEGDFNEIDLSSLEPGIYTIKVQFKISSITQKIVIL